MLTLSAPALAQLRPEPVPYPETPLPVRGSCPVSEEPPCVLTLEGPGAPAASPACSSEAWSKLLSFTLPGRWSDANADRSWETVLRLRLDPKKGCGCARFKVAYGDRVAAWTAHIGNSPTNNGHGGDEGTTDKTAEAYVFVQQLFVFSAAQTQRRVVDRLLDVGLPPLRGRTLEFEVCDQRVAVKLLPGEQDTAPLRWDLQTLNSRLLFALTAEEAIYAAFNRVIHDHTAAASHGRLGSGARRVEIALSP